MIKLFVVFFFRIIKLSFLLNQWFEITYYRSIQQSHSNQDLLLICLESSSICFSSSCFGRVVKALDLKSNGVSPRRFKSCRQRIFRVILFSTINTFNGKSKISGVLLHFEKYFQQTLTKNSVTPSFRKFVTTNISIFFWYFANV